MLNLSKKKLSGKKKIYETDVLIIGSGLAGLRAAIEASRYGVRVHLVDKSVIGYNSNTRISAGHIKAAAIKPRPFASSTPSSPIEHFKNKILIGEFLSNQRLTEILCFESPARKYELKDFGIIGLIGVDKKGLQDYYSFPYASGIITPLIKACKRIGVNILRNINIIDLISINDKVVGAYGFHGVTGDFIVFKAKNTILATGGAGEVYKRNDTAVTATGDGLAMAYRSGALLMDMEMQHFEPFVHSEDNLPMMDRREAYAAWFGILRNKLGEDFLPKYLKKFNPNVDQPFHIQYGVYNPDIRHIISRAMGTEVYENRGDQGAVFFDLSKVPDEAWNVDKSSLYLKHVLCRGYNLKKDWIHVMPGAITTLGGIFINEKGETSLSGLYASGEVAGGVHGAARFGGDALAEALVFGAIAGADAAKKSLFLKDSDLDNFELIERKLKKLEELFERESVISLKEIEKKIKDTMWENVGLVRTKTGLEKAIKQIKIIENDFNHQVFCKNLRDLRTVIEIKNMVQCSEMIVLSALKREETRGVHFRYDFPLTDNDKWLKNILVKKVEEEMVLSTQEVDFSWYKPDTIPYDTDLVKVLQGVKELHHRKYRGK